MSEYRIKITCCQPCNFAVNVFGSQTKRTLENLGTFSKWELHKKTQIAQLKIRTKSSFVKISSNHCWWC